MPNERRGWMRSPDEIRAGVCFEHTCDLPCPDCDAAELKQLRFEVKALTAQRDKVLAVVNSQAEDEGLWFIAATASEAYLQQELRKLHAVIEGALEVEH